MDLVISANRSNCLISIRNHSAKRSESIVDVDTGELTSRRLKELLKEEE